MTEMVVAFHGLNIAGNMLRDTVQFHDVSCLPDIGETCFIVTARDKEGNYSLDGKPQRRWSGTVVKREFSYEIHGKDAAHRRSVVYVDIYVDCGKQPQVEATDE